MLIRCVLAALLAGLCLAGLCIENSVQFAAAAEPAEGGLPKTPRELVLSDPNNVKFWDAYWGEQYLIIESMMNEDPKGTELFVEEVDALIRDHKPTADKSVVHVTKIQGTLGALRKSLAFLQIPLAELEQTMIANPDDLTAIDRYSRKAKMELKPLARTEPSKATEQVAAVRGIYQKVKDAAKQAKAKEAIEEAVKGLVSIDEEIIASRKQADIIGQPAAPMVFDAWVNGSPLTDTELRGKVVLLDFWAVWCGPCVASIPKLKQMQEKYGDKGLVIVGPTKYYNFRWDDENKKPAKAEDDVEPADEEAMLQKFADSHGIKYRIAVRDSSDLDQFYIARGIPMFVVIDQQGKVRLIRGGGGDDTMQAIEKQVHDLLEPKPASGS